MNDGLISALTSIGAVVVGSLITLLSQYIIEKKKYDYELKKEKSKLAINVYEKTIKYLQIHEEIEIETDNDKLDTLTDAKKSLWNQIEKEIFIVLNENECKEFYEAVRSFCDSEDIDSMETRKKISRIFKKYF